MPTLMLRPLNQTSLTKVCMQSPYLYRGLLQSEDIDINFSLIERTPNHSVAFGRPRLALAVISAAEMGTGIERVSTYTQAIVRPVNPALMIYVIDVIS